jgi:hypothetical protein
MDGRMALAASIVFATVVAAWMFRYDERESYSIGHRNRFTGVVCFKADSCWFSSDERFVPK